MVLSRKMLDVNRPMPALPTGQAATVHQRRRERKVPSNLVLLLAGRRFGFERAFFVSAEDDDGEGAAFAA